MAQGIVDRQGCRVWPVCFDIFSEAPLTCTISVTGRHRGLKQKLQAGYRARSLQRTCYVPSVIFAYWMSWSSVTDLIFSSSSVVSCTFSTLCMRSAMCALSVYSTFGHHPHPYTCAKFRFFRGLHCWASPWRKIAYSINQSLTRSPSLFHAPLTEAFASEPWIAM